MPYGQVTVLYEFGGADVFDPLEGICYQVDLERSETDEFVLGDVVRFQLLGETPWATVDAVVPIAEAPPHIREWLSDLGESWPPTLTG